MLTHETQYRKDIAAVAVQQLRRDALEAAVTQRKARQQALADGARKYWRGLSSCYCANAAELCGYDAAAEDDAQAYQERQARQDEYQANRESLCGW